MPIILDMLPPIFGPLMTACPTLQALIQSARARGWEVCFTRRAAAPGSRWDPPVPAAAMISFRRGGRSFALLDDTSLMESALGLEYVAAADRTFRESMSVLQHAGQDRRAILTDWDWAEKNLQAQICALGACAADTAGEKRDRLLYRLKLLEQRLERESARYARRYERHASLVEDAQLVPSREVLAAQVFARLCQRRARIAQELLRERPGTAAPSSSSRDERDSETPAQARARRARDIRGPFEAAS